MKSENSYQRGLLVRTLQLLAALVLMIGSSLSVLAAPSFPSEHEADCHMSSSFVTDDQTGCAERGLEAACIQHCLLTAILSERTVEADRYRLGAFPLSPDTGGMGAIVPVLHGPPKA